MARDNQEEKELTEKFGSPPGRKRRVLWRRGEKKVWLNWS